MNSKTAKSYEDEFEMIGEEDLMREEELRKSKKKKHKRDKSSRREDKSSRREDKKRNGKDESPEREEKPERMRDDKEGDGQQAPGSKPASAKKSKDESNDDDFIIHFDDSKDASDSNLNPLNHSESIDYKQVKKDELSEQPAESADEKANEFTSSLAKHEDAGSKKSNDDAGSKKSESNDTGRGEKLGLKENQNSNRLRECVVEPNSNAGEKLREELNRAEAVKEPNEPSDSDPPVELNKAKKSTRAKQTPPKANEKAAKSSNSPSKESTPKVSTPKVSVPKESTPKVTTPKKSTPKVTTPKKFTPKASTPKTKKLPEKTTRSSPNDVESPSSGRPKRELSRSASKQPAVNTPEPLSKRRKCTMANDPLQFVKPVDTPVIGIRLGLSRRRSVKSSLHPELFGAQQS